VPLAATLRHASIAEAARLLAFGLLLVAALAFVAAAQASSGSRPSASGYTLAEVSLANAGGSAGIDTVASVVFCIDNDFQNCSTHVDSLTFPHLTAASAGSTVWADTTGPGFAMVVRALTDGASDFLGYQTATPNWLAGPGWFIAPEPSFFSGQTGASGVDLAGYAIQAIGFRVDSVQLASPGENPNGDGNWTDFSVRGVFVFEGRVASRAVCRDGGWQNLRGPDGPFSNQGECIAVANGVQ
jgi:hypothetical protein